EQLTGQIDSLLDAGLGDLGAVRTAGQGASKGFNRPAWTLGTWARRKIGVSRFDRRCGVGRISHFKRPSQAYAPLVRERCPEAGDPPGEGRRQRVFCRKFRRIFISVRDCPVCGEPRRDKGCDYASARTISTVSASPPAAMARRRSILG